MAPFDVIEAISGLPLLSYIGVEDFPDKMSFIGSCVLLIVCSLIVTVREYVMDPISCYLSQNPGGENLLKFIENYCWVQGTMTIDNHMVPTTEKEWQVFENSRLVYYQWVPLMLLFQSALFHVPRILWSMFTFNMTGTNVQHIMKKAAQTKWKHADTKIQKLALRIEYMLFEHREYRRGNLHDIKRRIYETVPLCMIGKRFANWLPFGYLITKILYLFNSIGQIYLMQVFLQLHNNKQYSSNFGMEIARNIMNGHNWEITNVFPRVTYCMARVKHMAAINTVTAQCVLTANLFIEKIYIFLWFWIVIVSIATACSLIVWLVRFLFPSRYQNEVKKYLKLHIGTIQNDKYVDGFCDEFLRRDGIFILQMITINAGDSITIPLVNHLYAIYLEKYKDKTFTKSDDFTLSRNNYETTNRMKDGQELLPK